MAIERHGPAARDKMRRAGRVAAQVLAELCDGVRPGVTGLEIDDEAQRLFDRYGAQSSCFGYQGFPAAICISPNEVICHGIPNERALQTGDIVNLDVACSVGGYHSDNSRTVGVGEVDEPSRALIDATRWAMEAGIAAVAPGGRLGDVGAAVEASAKRAGYWVVEAYCGHGIGTSMHQPPQVVHVGPAGRGVRLRPGMTFTIEPMLTLGRVGHRLDPDGWTVRTADASRTAQFEHTVLVTEAGVEILTAAP